MARMAIDAAQLGGIATFVRVLIRFVRRTAIVALVALVPIAVLLARGGFTLEDVVVGILLLAPPVILLLFAQGVRELLSLPARLRRIPRDGQERLGELTRVAGQARTTRLRGMPILLWRLRGALGSVRDVAGVAVPLRVLTPAFLAVALAAWLACVVVAAIGVVALLVLAGG